MLKDLLQSMNNDADDANGVGGLVVTALGPSGRHYICWKTNSGQYKQQSHGLPKRLQEWLFPSDGSTRDFETLQVILSGDDTFWASDKNGDLRSDESNSNRNLRRALTFSDDTPASAGNRRLSRARETTISAPVGTERPRSNTLPSKLSPGSHAPELSPRPPSTHGRSTSTADRPRRVSAIPLAFVQQRRKSAIRPPSVSFADHDDLAVLKEHPSPPVARRPSNASFNPRRSLLFNRCDCECGCHGHSSKAQPLMPSTKRRSGYADASVQTDTLPDPDEPVLRKASSRTYDHHRELSFASTASFESDVSPNSQRSSFETTVTRPDSCSLDILKKHEYQQPPNPVVMGRMQDYFRSTTYVLGGALHTSGMG
ncbi:Uu.00g131700.m01.CDS01 [Anthostomella pinea]|uniref:Uu.00g131700.m01.CDS01 n=1 Tax=Anthostomella pinea TaxID=933095 RepID=A0AAI8YIB0_9PEZI|nr:Uu.00g131700.m01.CDS01 [Anthostomella pinea]